MQELAETITAEEYNLWMAWHMQEPLDASWWQAGMQASTLANVNRGKDVDPFSAADFMPSPWAKKEPENEPDPVEFFKNLNG